MNQELLKTILAESGKAAKANITRRTPQIAELIEAVEKWIIERVIKKIKQNKPYE
jgi:arsenate reductase-like glutaredoxin family protein